MAVGGSALLEEIGLTLCHLAKSAAGGADLENVDSVKELLAAQPTKLFAGEGIGEQLETVAGTVGGGNLAGLLLGGLQLAAVAAAVLHAEGVVDIDAHRRGARLQLLFARQRGLGKG